MQPNPNEKTAAEKLVEEKLGDFSQKETEQLVDDFQSCFDECVSACKKPNILVTGITGAGKSTLVNAIFGSSVSNVGVGKPVTQHFQKFEPKELPIVLYDSKGLEWDQHEAFIHETTGFFSELRAKKEVSDHIHCVWYVINCGRGRIDDFELKLLRDVIAPTPVLFVLNKSDLSDSEQILKLQEVIESSNLENNKGVFVTVSSRKNYTQGWCPKCYGDDVFYDEETKELECVEDKCGLMIKLGPTLGLEKLVEVTTELLPEFAKDAFMFCQKVSQRQKDERAKVVVKGIVKNISLDLKGAFIKKVAEMCAKMFVIWGYPLTAGAFRDEISKVQAEYCKELGFKERFLISSIDTLLRKKISKCFTAVLGMTMNRGMKKLNESLISHTRNGTMDEMKVEDFMSDSDMDEDLVMLFFEKAFFDGVSKSLDQFWSISRQELEEMKQKSRLMESLQQHSQFGEGGGQEEVLFEGRPIDMNNEEEVMRVLLAMQQNEALGIHSQPVQRTQESGVKIEFLDDDDDGKKDEEEEHEGEDEDKKGDDFDDGIGLD